MKKVVKCVLPVCLAGVFCSIAGPQPKSPPSNAKEQGPLQEYNKQLKESGLHRKVANRVTDELAHTFGDEVRQPLPNMNEHINRLVANYQTRFSAFEDNFVGARRSYKRSKKRSEKPGEWRHIEMNPTAGRIYDLELNPKNPNELYANPDADGIFFTKDRGKNWKSITDNIPSRLHRDSYENIIVDPWNFKHVFSISHLGKLFVTKDRGETWTYVKNSKGHDGRAPQFKWVEAFRDEKKNLIIIGTVTNGRGLNGGWQRGIYRSADGGQSWQRINVDGDKFQEMAFHQGNRNIVYLANQSQFFVSTNAGQSFKKVKDFGTGDRPMFISTLPGKLADSLYVAVSTGKDTQVYFSKNRGKSWKLKQDSVKGKGYDKGIFGNDGSSGWTSFFAVDPFNPNHLVASSVGSCESFDGGVTWQYQSWGRRADAVMPDASIAPAPHGGHNADNHVLKFHPREKGFMVKGCDAGIMMKTAGKKDNWVNINGDMPAFMWYSLVVNEFGDRYIAGNTQDVNIQTNRYGIWENENGYEGDTIFINPYTNITYYPCAQTEEGEGKGFLEPGGWKMHSWNYPKTAANYSDPDQFFIAFGRRPSEPEAQLPKYLYMSEDRGMNYKRVSNVDQEVYSVNMSRTPKQVLTAFTKSAVMKTTDLGKTWETKQYPNYFRHSGGSRSVSGAVNPINPAQMWVGGRDGKVIATTDGGNSWYDISGKLPKGQVSELVFHEGSKGDLYALVNGFGVFFRAADSEDWKLWMDGFNLKDFREIRIDYPNQKLVAASYGRGAWEARLQNPCERFYKNGFAIKQLNSIGGTKVFGIDSTLVTPDYYNYQWYHNKKATGGNSPVLLLRNCKAGDAIVLKITPKHFPAVKTLSRTIKVKGKSRKLDTARRKPAEVKGDYIDLGNLELYSENQNFSFEAMINLESSGVIAGNRRKFFRDAKGWYLSVDDDGSLSLHLSAKQNGLFSRTFKKPHEQALVVKSTGSKVKLNQWTHVAFTVDRRGEAVLYVNGERAGAKKMNPSERKISLNSVLSTTLFADAIGNHRSSGKIQYVRIWNKAVEEKLLKANKNKLVQTDCLVYYINFFNQKGGREQFRNEIIKLKLATTK